MAECCSNLFEDFYFEDLVSAKPPSEKGVYVIRVSSRGDVPVTAMIEKVKECTSRIGWDLVEKFVMNRLKRLKNIGKCPIIYIGSAGGQRGSKNTLKGRYKEFSNRHTAMYPIWVLLYFKWKLEFGWKTSKNPLIEENKVKRDYQTLHEGKLPALVER
jgi:hypothetical protein